MKGIKCLIGLVFVIVICLGACQFSALPATETPPELPSPVPTETLSPTATHTATPTTTLTNMVEPTVTATTEVEVCTIEGVIHRAKELFRDKNIKFTVERFPEYELTPLSFIFVENNAIDPNAPKDLIFTEVNIALYIALRRSTTMVNSDPCIDELFDQIRPVIVDKNYNLWLEAQWNLSDLTSEDFPSEEASNRLMENSVTYWREEPTLKFDDPPPDSCSWAEVEEKIYSHFDIEGTSAGTEIYLIIDQEVTIWAHWGESDFELGFPVPSAIPYILNIALEAQCLYPQPDQIKFVMYDEAYVAKFVGVYEDPYDGDYKELDTLNIYPIE